MNDIFVSVGEFERKMSLPKGFYDKLRTEDDWSFIIKLSALFEAACTHTLVAKLNAPQLEECFSYLDQANTKFGKIKLLKKLGAIVPEQDNFLTQLASLRNVLAHDISNAGITLDLYVSKMDDNQKKTFVKWAGHGLFEELTFGDVTVSRYQFVLENPKFSIWLTAAEIIACMYLEVELADQIRKTSINWFKTIMEE